MILEILTYLTASAGMACLFLFGQVRLKSQQHEIVLIATFWICGVIFQIATLTAFVKPVFIILGPVLLLGFVFGLRVLAHKQNQHFALDRQTCLFLAGSGVWLGLEGGLLALILGSLAGLVYGAYQSIREDYPDLSMASFLAYKIPTAQSYAIGIFLSAIWTYKSAFGFV